MTKGRNLVFILRDKKIEHFLYIYPITEIRNDDAAIYRMTTCEYIFKRKKLFAEQKSVGFIFTIEDLKTIKFHGL